MIASEPFEVWMERLRSGEDAAAREIVRRFADRLMRLARRQFGRRLASRVDPEDVLQSAFKSFFVRQRAGTLRFDDWDDLWGLLAVITVRKCVDRMNYLHAGRRDVRREATPHGGREEPWLLALSRDPRPEEAAALVETVEDLLRSVEDEDREVLELSLQGFSAAEIGLRLGRALRSVQRLRERARKRLERQAATDLRVG